MFSGISTSVKLLHALNADSPIDVTLFGICIVVRASHLLNALAPILVMFLLNLRMPFPSVYVLEIRGAPKSELEEMVFPSIVVYQISSFGILEATTVSPVLSSFSGVVSSLGSVQPHIAIAMQQEARNRFLFIEY